MKSIREIDSSKIISFEKFKAATGSSDDWISYILINIIDLPNKKMSDIEYNVESNSWIIDKSWLVSDSMFARACRKANILSNYCYLKEMYREMYDN